MSVGVMTTGHEVQKNDFWDYWSGGGGYGDPLACDPERVLEDVRDNYVTPEGARRDYGVVVRTDSLVDDEWTVDSDATVALREELRENPPAEVEYPLPVPETAAWWRK